LPQLLNGKRHNTYVASQVATAAAAALYVTERTGVQPIGCTNGNLDLAAKQPHADHVCRLMVFIPVIHVITRITTHILIPKWWKMELAWLVNTQRTLYPWSGHINYRSGV